MYNQTSDTLEFSVNEFKEIELYDRFNTDNLNYHIVIHYEEGLIKSVDSKTSLVRTSDVEGELSYNLIDTHHIIQNNYEGSFSRLEKYAYRAVETSDIENTYGSFYEFQENEYEVNEFTTSYDEIDDYYRVSCTNSANNLWCGSNNTFSINQEDDVVTITQPNLMETVIRENESVDYIAPYSDNLFVEYEFTYIENYNLYLKTYDQPYVSSGDNYITTEEKDGKLILYYDSALFNWASSDNTVYEFSKEEIPNLG